MELKGQAALDFLMTYGWALLLIVLAVGALFALGVFDVGTFLGSRATGFTQIGVAAWRVNSSGNLTMQLSNHAGTDINVTNVSWTYRGTTTWSNISPVTILNGQTSSTLDLGNVPGITAAGTNYVLHVDIIYTDLNTLFVYRSTGTLTGRSG